MGVKKTSKSRKETVDELEERAINLVLDCKQESLDFYEEKFKTFNYYDLLYIRGAKKRNVPYGRANLELPLGFQQVEPYVDQMSATMAGEAPYIAYTGRGPEDDQVAQEITDFTQYQIECGSFYPAYVNYLRNLGKYGTAAMKVPWETEYKEVFDEQEVPITEMQINPATGLPEKVIVGTQIERIPRDYKIHDGPKFYNKSLFDIFIPKSATSPNVQKMSWIIDRTYHTIEDLINNPNYARAKDKLKKFLDSDDDDNDESDFGISNIKDESKRISVEQNNPSKGSAKFQGQWEVLEWWGDFKFERGGDKKPALLTIAVLEDENICLRLDENPTKYKFKPFLMSNNYSVDGEPYGYGELHHIKGLIEESTALRNARLDVANISLNRVWLVERQAGVNLRELYTAPNKIILTNDLNGIKPMDMGSVTPSSVQELARIDFDIQNTTEIVNPRQDVASVGGAFSGTATGVNYLSGKSNRRLLSKARLQEETFFKPLAQMLNWYNQDLITDEVYYRVSGQDNPNPYRTITPDAFLTEVDYKSTSSPEKLSVEERRGEMSYLLQTLAQIEKVAGPVNNWEKLLVDVHKLAGHPHPQEYILPRQTTVMQTPQGQLVDQKGMLVQVVPVDETGKPVEQPPMAA